MPNSPLPPVSTLALSARARLAAEREHLDAINVYPVADGDTGSNLLATVDAIAAALRDEPADPAQAAADAALMGARGNSGTILSALVRTAVLSLTAPVDGAAITQALHVGAEAAYAAVPEPTEGTMLTVARAAAEASTGETVAEALRSALAGARVALERTPQQLAQLTEREAGKGGRRRRRRRGGGGQPRRRRRKRRRTTTASVAASARAEARASPRTPPRPLLLRRRISPSTRLPQSTPREGGR